MRNAVVLTLSMLDEVFGLSLELGIDNGVLHFSNPLGVAHDKNA